MYQKNKERRDIMGSLTDIEKQTIVDMKQSGAKLKDIVAETGKEYQMLNRN